MTPFYTEHYGTLVSKVRARRLTLVYLTLFLHSLQKYACRGKSISSRCMMVQGSRDDTVESIQEILSIPSCLCMLSMRLSMHD